MLLLCADYLVNVLKEIMNIWQYSEMRILSIHNKTMLSGDIEDVVEYL
jgi:hypothetical protein